MAQSQRVDVERTPGLVFAGWPLVVGLLVLYLPTFFRLATGAWRTENNAHGPLILACIVFAFWDKRESWLSQSTAGHSAPALGIALLVIGLTAYVTGRSQDILTLEVGSLIPVLSGLLLSLRSANALKQLWFPLLFIVFLIPLPGALVDTLTLPLKESVSAVVDELLYRAGYPVARSGVVLTIGPYQMLVADACSGLNSMYTLSALCLFYIYLRQYTGIKRNALLLLFVLPIAFLANIGRVVALLLITYYFGDAAGRSFLHDFAGFAELVVALLALFVLDGAVARIASGERS